MPGGIRIDIDAVGLQAMAAEVGATQAQLEAAMRSTYGRMGRWARTRAVRGLSPRLNIQQKILRRRVRHFRLQHGVSGQGGAKVWFGLKPVRFSHLRPVQTARGVRAAGGRFEEGAFIVRRGNSQKVFKRTGPGRLPIREVEVDISEQSQVYIEDNLVGSPEFEEQFFRTLQHELRWRTR